MAIGLFSRQVVGWAMDNHIRTLQMAFWRRKPAQGLLFITPTVASQYASKEYREYLAIMGMEQSMSRKGNCSATSSCVALPPASMQSWDNAPTERFFRSLKYEQSQRQN